MIPPRPAVFSPDSAPNGVAIDFVSFYTQRQMQTPRITLVHTNGASGPATIASAKRWAEAAPNSNTLPHYQVQLDGKAAKFCPTDRRGLDNASASPDDTSLTAAQRLDLKTHGQVRNWSIGIETSDHGWPVPGGTVGFEPKQGETLATILAYESVVWDIPLEYPTSWWGTGTACHTEPFTYPYWTLFRGKACPGDAKKRDMREWILPRALQILTAWMGGDNPSEEPDMTDAQAQQLAELHSALVQPQPGFSDPSGQPGNLNAAWAALWGEALIMGNVLPLLADIQKRLEALESK
jgi:hypothetical protein